MAKTEFPKQEQLKDFPAPPVRGGGLASKLTGLFGKLFNVVKFALGVCALPCVYAATAGFLTEFNMIDKGWRGDFWSGVISMLVIYLFIWEPVIVYTKGQQMLEFLFMFLKPLVRVAPYLLPVYTLIIFLFYSMLSWFIKGITGYFMFLSGLTVTLHLIFSAKTMRGKKEDFLKGNYLFGFSFIYIINVMLLAAYLSSVFEKFSFINFSTYSYQIAKGIFSSVFAQLFL
jgi:hypothetical protein